MSWFRNRRGDQGVAATEFILIFPLFAIIVLGLFSAGTGYFRMQSITQGAREAARFGATLPPDDDDGVVFDAWLEAVADRADQASGGRWEYICVAYVGPPAKDGEELSGAVTSREERDEDGTVTNDSSPCFVDDRPDEERRAQVLIERDTQFGAYFFSTTIRLGSKGIARYEAIRPKDE